MGLKAGVGLKGAAMILYSQQV